MSNTRKNNKHNKNKKIIVGKHKTELLNLFRSKERYKSISKKNSKLQENYEFNGWHLVFLYLLLTPTFAVLLNDQKKDYSKSTTIHNQRIKPISYKNCRVNEIGSTPGLLCTMDETSYYLKKFPKKYSIKEISTTEDMPGMISYEEFNRQFVKNNIDSQVPPSVFLRTNDEINNLRGDPDITRRLRGESLFIGSEKMKVRFFQKRDLFDTIRNLIPINELSKLAVVTSFIDDMHLKNWGINNQGVVFIDVDSNNRIPKSRSEYASIAMLGLTHFTPQLTIDHVMHMLQIYEEMKKRPLPEFHEEFNLTYELYYELLDRYSLACQMTIDKIKKYSDNDQCEKNALSINEMLADEIKSIFDDSHYHKLTQSKNKPIFQL